MQKSFVSSLTWTEIQERLDVGASAILPVGSAAKQHGWHMPMGTDQIQTEWFAEKLAYMIGGLVWPTVTYGPYPAFAAYAGSITIAETTFELLIENIAREILRFGAREVVILNAGISTIIPIDRTIATLQAGQRVRHVPIYNGSLFKNAVQSVCTQKYGSHADEAETSIMLEIRPEVVVSGYAQVSSAFAESAMPGPLSPTDKYSPNYSPSGSFGDPSLATVEKGQALVNAILSDLSAIFSPSPGSEDVDAN